MILSASRRTDIPCYYTEWFINRLKAGYVLVRNPMNNAQLSRVQLTPDVVDCIVFWTKDAKNILPHLRTIDEMGYKYYFQFTITPYGRDVEPNLRNKQAIEGTLIELSKSIGKEGIVWRYDPIILNEFYTVDYHKTQFELMCRKLSPYTESVVISFVDNYAKLKTQLIRDITEAEITELAEFIGETAKTYGIIPKACCEGLMLEQYGIEKSSCIDKELIERIIGCNLDIMPDKNQRNGYGCVESIDVGAYNTCLNGCVYCYANNSVETTLKRHDSHDTQSEMLIGTVKDQEKIIHRKVKSNRQGQMKLI